MAGAAAQVGALKNEAEKLSSAKKEYISQQKQIESGISQLKSEKKNYEGKLGQLHGALAQINSKRSELKSHPAGEDHPDVAKALNQLSSQKSQIIEQISVVKRGMKQMNVRIGDFEAKKLEVRRQAEMIGKAAEVRKAMYEKYAGMLSQQNVRTNTNRETGKLKG